MEHMDITLKVLLIVLAGLALLGAAGLVVMILWMGGMHLPMFGMGFNVRHMMPTGPGFWWPGVLRISIPLLLISLMVLRGVWIGRSSRPTIIQNITAAPVEPAPQPDPICAACGKEMNAEWIVCPFCGNHR